jgi:hypothetical protein
MPRDGPSPGAAWPLPLIFDANSSGTSLEAVPRVLIPEPGLVVLVASGLLALASVVRNTTPL